MLRGVPVICTDYVLWQEIIDKYKCGICVAPGDLLGLTKAIRYIVDHPDEARVMGENGRKAVFEKYNWKTQEKELFTLYDNLAMKGDI